MIVLRYIQEWKLNHQEINSQLLQVMQNVPNKVLEALLLNLTENNTTTIPEVH